MHHLHIVLSTITPLTCALMDRVQANRATVMERKRSLFILIRKYN